MTHHQCILIMMIVFKGEKKEYEMSRIFYRQVCRLEPKQSVNERINESVSHMNRLAHLINATSEAIL